MLGFASLCVEATAKKVGCSYLDMYNRLYHVGILQGLTKQLDPLHTQSLDYVTTDILNALTRLEAKTKTV